MASSLSSAVAPLASDGDEQTPLLATVSPTPLSESAEAAFQAAQANGTHLDDEDAPLPLLQIFLLCVVRMVEPIAFFSIFPYINFMIEKTGGIDKKDVGFYSGLIESLFSATQMCVMVFWSRAADRFGRKPCIVVSLFGTATAMSLFGMSTAIWQMIMFRCIAGVFSGSLVSVRTMISENSTKKTQARAFSYFAFAGNLGIFIGPLIGGVFERPAEKFPSLLGRFQFLHDYPYALPALVTASLSITAAILSAIFLRETLHLQNARNSKQAAVAPMSTWELLKCPGVFRVLFIYNYVVVIALCFTAVLPVFLYTDVDLGGLGFTSSLIAGAICLNGVSQAVWTLAVFAPLQHRVGTGGILRACSRAWPFFFLIHPLCNFFLRNNLKALFWTLGPMSMVLGSGVAMAFTANQLAVNDIAPTHETLGTLNAIALAAAGGLRAIVPALAASIYATGVKYHIAGGQLFWIIGIALTCALPFVVSFFPEKAEGRVKDGGEEVEGVE